MSDERTSGPAAPSLTARQQLEASLAAGTLTPELFATLSAQLPPDQPSPPAAPPTPAKPAFSPSGNDAELPSLLDMFNQPPTAPAGPPPTVPPAPVAPPAPVSQSRTSAADAAARRLIEERLTQIRQRPAAEPPTAPPAPTRAPTFYPETPAPTLAATPTAAPAFYPAAPVEQASPPPAPPRQASPRPSAPPAKPAAGSAGGVGKWLLLVLLVLLVGGTLAYFFIQNSHPDESLTSPSLPAAEPAATEVAAPKPAKKTKKSTKKKRKKKESTPIAAVEVEAAPEEETTAPASEPAAVAATPVRAVPATSQPIAAAPETGDDAATTKVREALASYYADLNAPPLHASQHFAPQVERLYIQQNLTPATIDAELARSFFPENQQAVARIAPGTLRVSAPAADGSRTATFTEDMRLYRVSKQQFQRLRTNVRVRFNPDYQITYMRQEKLLANTFE